MNILELGAIGELVGGLAVIGSLIFVGMQVRNGTREQQNSSMHEAARAFVAGVQALQQPGIAEVWLRGMNDFDALEPGDRLRFAALLVHLLRMFEQLFHQQRDHGVEADVWQGFERQLRDWASTVGFSRFWAARGHWFGDEFRLFVEAHMGGGAPRDAYGAFERGAAPS